MEHVTAKDSGAAVVSRYKGVVEHVEAREVNVRRYVDKNGDGNYTETSEVDKYILVYCECLYARTCYTERSIVSIGEEVEKGEILADCPSMDNGEMALGQNLVV